MKGRFKTEQELLNSGWYRDSAILRHKYADFAIPYSMLVDLSGKWVETNRSSYEITSGWAISPEMLANEAQKVKEILSNYNDELS
jgi:hypothetical protein